MKVQHLIEQLQKYPDDSDVMLMVPDNSGKPGHVFTYRLREIRLSTNSASTMANWSDRICILEGK